MTERERQMEERVEERTGPGGIQVTCRGTGEAAAMRAWLVQGFKRHAFAEELRFGPADGPHGTGAACRPVAGALARWAPAHDTLSLAQRLVAADARAPDGAEPEADGDWGLDREILAAMLLGPSLQAFASLAELQSAVRIRANIVRASRLTTLAFHTRAVERPFDLWVYDEDRGFMIREGASLIDALRKATQPGVSGTLYAFSCYRASEYVMLLGLAEELQHCNPPLYRELEALWHRRAVVSGEFHEVFLRETGSVDDPLPPRWYVPGDRVWFRNPDEASADASGFEGSWVVYLGGGLFSNFWKRDQPFDFESKCLEVYHWRHATYLDAEREIRIDEAKVADLVAATRSDPAEVARVLECMQRYRDPRGVYADGGCIDSTREQIKWVCPGTADLALPSD